MFKKSNNDNAKGEGGCFQNALICILTILIGLWLIGKCEGNDEVETTSTENYNDNSTVHRIFAKNCFVDYYLKKNLKDAKSYEEVSYTSDYSYTKGCYEVTIKYRAKNSFGALVLETISGDVYFEDDNVSIRNVSTGND